MRGATPLFSRLKDKDGKEYLTASRVLRPDARKVFFDAVVGTLPAAPHTSITGLTPRKIQAVREGSLFRGMSLSAVYQAIGFPEKKNDWGRGGQQLIYAGGAILVYVDSTEHVTGWQDIDR
jgi:hypothetical protein